MEALHQPEPLEGIPETPPLRLYLPGRQNAVGIGANGEKRCITEVQQPGKTDDDVEAQRQHGKGRGVRRRVEIAAVAVDQREDEQEDRDIEHDQPPAPFGRQAFPPGQHAAARGFLGYRFAHALSYDLRGTRRPSRPFGRKTSTRIRIEKMITSVQRVAINWPPRDSIRPMMIPTSIAPGMLPMPPRTAAVKARKPAVYPIT